MRVDRFKDENLDSKIIDIYFGAFLTIRRIQKNKNICLKDEILSILKESAKYFLEIKYVIDNYYPEFSEVLNTYMLLK
jgi:hypothetical protein